MQQDDPTESDENTRLQTLPDAESERDAFVRLDPSGFQIRHPPPPHELITYITPDAQLFQTIHMGAAVVDYTKYRLVIDGLVSRPLALTLADLKQMPQTSITAFHECYGSPLLPPTTSCLRIGNVHWTGVRLSHLLALAGCQPSSDPRFVWSTGLDRGTFAGVRADAYQKDLPIAKALRPEVLVAYAMNGRPLSKERGGPVRLVVPGFFGTNSTKWLARLEVRAQRASGPYTTTFYNERDLAGRVVRPVWNVEVNCMIVSPGPGEVIKSSCISVHGWAWSDEGVEVVEVSSDGGRDWLQAGVEDRFEYGWQRFDVEMILQPGQYKLMARATCSSGNRQPLSGHRNHVHSIEVLVE
ncbi:Oxidoreductase, molybdopterin-binding domain-containing protein [Phaeosphaeria sp. MPI-PUGE-AT-0046c]|nr:Oxidoreductase, molybdopterin-binding domain-containing protein [Phaeosphaeria sp. MPI-PUGE-AT-0046c]